MMSKRCYNKDYTIIKFSSSRLEKIRSRLNSLNRSNIIRLDSIRPDFYANNLEKVRAIIAPVIEDYKSGKITYAEAEFNARTMIYQSVKPDFNPNVEYMKDPMSRDIPSVDNSLFILARKLILNSINE